MTDASQPTIHSETPPDIGWRAALPTVLPFVALFGFALLLPLTGNEYWALIATRAAIYWVLVAGLNLVVGYAGQLAIGYVALLTLGAYTTSVLAAGNVLPPLPTFLALAVAAVAGAVFGVVVGLPALRLRTFYFAMATLGFATIVTQVALAWQGVTGGGIGISGPEMPAPFNTAWGFLYLCLALAALVTWATSNVAKSRFGRALIAVRDADVAAEANGISKPKLFVTIFLFSGAVAAVAGGLFASLQTYITPDAFTFELSLLFFIAVLIGGRGSILGPLIGTIILTILPEIAAPLAAWSTFLYAGLLLIIVLAMPGGIAALLDVKNRKPLQSDRAIKPRPALLGEILKRGGADRPLTLKGIVLTFGGVRAIDGLDLDIQPGQVHGLIGPNGSGKTTTLNVISGYYAPQEGEVRLDFASDKRRARDPGWARHRPHLPDAADCRRGVGHRQCDDRRLDRGAIVFRGNAHVAATPSSERAEPGRGRAPCAARSRAGGTGRCQGRPAAAQRAALRRDRARADAETRLPAA